MIIRNNIKTVDAYKFAQSFSKFGPAYNYTPDNSGKLNRATKNDIYPISQNMGHVITSKPRQIALSASLTNNLKITSKTVRPKRKRKQ